MLTEIPIPETDPTAAADAVAPTAPDTFTPDVPADEASVYSKTLALWRFVENLPEGSEPPAEYIEFINRIRRLVPSDPRVRSYEDAKERASQEWQSAEAARRQAENQLQGLGSLAAKASSSAVDAVAKQVKNSNTLAALQQKVDDARERERQAKIAGHRNWQNHLAIERAVQSENARKSAEAELASFTGQLTPVKPVKQNPAPAALVAQLKAARSTYQALKPVCPRDRRDNPRLYDQCLAAANSIGGLERELRGYDPLPAA